MPTVGEFWDRFDEDRDPTEIGGGVISRCEILTGYRVFPPDGERPVFFPVRFDDMDGREEELEKAKKIGARPQWGVRIKAFKNSAYKMGDEGFALVEWKEDREEFCAKWTDAFKEIFAPAFRELGIIPWLEEAYCRLGWRPDPFFEKQGEEGKKKGADGKMYFDQVMFPLEVYADAAAAQAAVEGIESSNGKVLPREWADDEKGWKKEIADIRESVGKVRGKRLRVAVEKHIAAAYGTTEDDTGLVELGATVNEVLDWLN